MRNLVTEITSWDSFQLLLQPWFALQSLLWGKQLLLYLENYVEKDLVAIILNLLESPFLSLVVEHHPLPTSFNCPANQNEAGFHGVWNTWRWNITHWGHISTVLQIKMSCQRKFFTSGKPLAQSSSASQLSSPATQVSPTCSHLSGLWTKLDEHHCITPSIQLSIHPHLGRVCITI